jgi:hypothetical protein
MKKRWPQLVPLLAVVMAVAATLGASGAGASTTGLCATPYAGAVLANSPMVYYRMADTALPASVTMFDCSSSHRDGAYTTSGHVTQGGDSAVGESGDFSVTDDGSDLVGTVPGAVGGLPGGDSARTVEAWYKDATNAQQFTRQALVAWSGFTLVVNNDGRSADSFSVLAGNGIETFTWPNHNIEDGNWHHIAVTYDASASPSWAGYVDGNALTISSNTTPPVASDGGAQLVVGSDGCCSNLNGAIDEVAIYGSALTAAQLASHDAAAAGNCGCAASTDPTQANTCVGADVMSSIAVTAPASLDFGQIAPGETAQQLALIDVQKNSSAGGYQLSVTRTAFTGGTEDLILGVTCDTSTDASGTHCQAPASANGGDLEWDLPNPGVTPPPSGWTIPVGSPSAPIGHRVDGATGAGSAADEWPTRLSLTVPADAGPGHYSATVTYSVVLTTP